MVGFLDDMPRGGAENVVCSISVDTSDPGQEEEEPELQWLWFGSLPKEEASAAHVSCESLSQCLHALAKAQLSGVLELPCFKTLAYHAASGTPLASWPRHPDVFMGEAENTLLAHHATLEGTASILDFLKSSGTSNFKITVDSGDSAVLDIKLLPSLLPFGRLVNQAVLYTIAMHAVEVAKYSLDADAEGRVSNSTEYWWRNYLRVASCTCFYLCPRIASCV